MASPSNFSASKSPATPTMTTDLMKIASSVSAISPVSLVHKAGFQSREKRRKFLSHLTTWSLDHDASLHFQGEIMLLPPDTRGGGNPELGKPVTCVLTDSSYVDARQIIVIKLFPPQESTPTLQEVESDGSRKDSMDLYDYQRLQKTTKDISITRQHHATPRAKGRYKLVVRCGAGWMSSRDYFNKIYFSHLESRPAARLNMSKLLVKRSHALGLPPSDRDSVTIRPLFRPFRMLPAELQEMVLKTAAGLCRNYDLCSDDYGITSVKKNRPRSAISVSTMFQMSKSITEHLLPFVYHATDFHFGLTGFTNFLWQSGPANRREVRRLTFHFGKLALLHCIRWLAPDLIFELFEPPVATNPRSLQYFWRCQIQELVKELNLLTLTLDIKHIPIEDLPMIVAIVKGAFGSVETLQFVDGNTLESKAAVVSKDDPRLKGLYEVQTWRGMCLGYYRRHRLSSYYFRFELLKSDEQVLGDAMDTDKDFYDQSFSVLGKTSSLPWK